nr:hypothetical protein [Tanacetum cinerariifolium]
MSTQQDIYAAGFKSRPPMLNKENYVPWSSRLLRYAKSRPNGKLIHNSILNGPYVKKMIPEPGDANREITTILLGLPEDIYAAVDSYETAQEIWLRVQQMMKGFDIEFQEKKAKLFNEWKRNKHFPEKTANNLKFLNNLQPEWSRHVTIVHQTKDLHIADYTKLYDFMKYNQKEVDDLKAERLAKTQDPVALMANSNNPYYAGQNAGNPARYNDVIGNQLIQNAIQNPKKEEAGIQLQPEEYDLMAAAADLDEIEEVNANYILIANLQQASTSGTQTDSAPVYDTDGSAENDNDVISEDTSVEQGGETVEQHSANFEETCVLYESLYQNLAIEVEKVNSVNRI